MNGTLSTVKFSDLLMILVCFIGCLYMLVIYNPNAVRTHPSLKSKVELKLHNLENAAKNIDNKHNEVHVELKGKDHPGLG